MGNTLLPSHQVPDHRIQKMRSERTCCSRTARQLIIPTQCRQHPHPRLCLFTTNSQTNSQPVHSRTLESSERIRYLGSAGISILPHRSRNKTCYRKLFEECSTRTSGFLEVVYLEGTRFERKENDANGRKAVYETTMMLIILH